MSKVVKVVNISSKRWWDDEREPVSPNVELKVSKERPKKILSIRDLPELLTVAEVVGVLKFSADHIYDLIKSKKLRAVPVGRQYRIPVDAIDEYLRVQSLNKRN